MANENKKELPMWKRIKQGDKLPCQSFLRKYDGEILRLTTHSGVAVGQDCFYLPVENVIEEIMKYPIEESKDEKMIQYFKDLAPFDKAEELYEKYGFSHKDAIAWLEKQGKQNRYTPMFTFDDVLALQCAMANAKDSDEKLYHALQSLHDRVHDAYSNEKQDEQKPTGWSEKLIADVFEKVGLAKIVRDQENDAFTEALQSAMIELAKYSVDPQPKQEWSEEDKIHLHSIESTIEYCKRESAEATLVVQNYNKDLDWLKSLRPQSTWRPSKEQVMALRWVLNHIPYNSHKEEISGLLEQFLKLYNYGENR